jgi:hypothetical protein
MFRICISSDIITSIVDNVVVGVVLVVVPFKVVPFGEGGGEVAVHKGAMICVMMYVLALVRGKDCRAFYLKEMHLCSYSRKLGDIIKK